MLFATLKTIIELRIEYVVQSVDKLCERSLQLSVELTFAFVIKFA